MADQSSHAVGTPATPGWLAKRAAGIQQIIYLLIVIVIFAGDQITKNVVEHTIPHGAAIPVIPGFFDLIRTENSGIAFSLFAGASHSWKMVLMIGVSIALLVAVVIVALKSREMNWGTGVGLGLVVGGACSNLLDRMRFGQVVDFLDFYHRSYHWATFNVADSAIVAGAILLLLQILFTK
ncbi:MAG TPA: signal peptidase II [Terriglobia bacterium]|nr:signal peptidase II [Terriglobia bacterium]